MHLAQALLPEPLVHPGRRGNGPTRLSDLLPTSPWSAARPEGWKKACGSHSYQRAKFSGSP